jgi:hypothetical protein
MASAEVSNTVAPGALAPGASDNPMYHIIDNK